jgi:hypothetical protein
MSDAADELEAIRHTLATYNVSGDRGRLDALAGAFAPDGVLQTATSRLVGREAIAQGLGGGRGPSAGGAPARTFVRHNQTTQALELTGPNAAAARTYFIVFTDIGPDHAGCYVDTLRKIDGQWLIQHRRVMIEWMAEQTTSGARGLPPERE